MQKKGAGKVTVRTEERKSGIRPAAEAVFAVATGASLICSLLAILTWSQGWTTPMWLTVLRCFTAVLGLALCDAKDRGFRILAGYLALIILRLAIPSPETLFTQSVSETLLFGAWAFLACYTLGNVLGPKRIRRFMAVFMTAWALCTAVLSGIALYAAWTDRKVWNLGQGAFWGLNNVTGGNSSRLKMFFDANTSGTLFGLGVTAAFICAAGIRNRWMKALHILLLLPCWTALSLTDSRTAQISVAIGIGLAAGILILRALHGKKPGQKRRARDAAAACGALLTAAACVALLFGTTAAFNGLKAEKGKILAGAGAEEAPAQLTVVLEQEEYKAGLGEKLQFSVKAEGAEGKVSYQWQYSRDGGAWTDMKGAAARKRTLNVTVKAATYKRQYRCAVTCGNRTVASEPITILEPYSVKLAMKTSRNAGGDTVILTAVAEGAEGEPSFLWEVSGDGGKTWTEAKADDKAEDRLTAEVSGMKQYRCTVTAGNGMVTSAVRRIKEPTGTLIQARGFDADDLLSGRTWIWRQTLEHLRDNPLTLLTGRSVANPTKDTGIMRTETIETEHCHNMFLQTLLESGIPGLALMIAFIACTARRAVRLIRAEDAPMLLRLVPAAVCTIWVGELTECIVRMSNYRVPNFALLMLYAGVVCALGRRGDAKAAEKETQNG